MGEQMTVALSKRLDKIQHYTNKIKTLSTKKQKELGDRFLEAGLALSAGGKYQQIFAKGKRNSNGFLKKFYAELEQCTPLEIDILSKYVTLEKIGDMNLMPLESVLEVLQSNKQVKIVTVFDCGVQFQIFDEGYFIRCDRRNVLYNNINSTKICEFTTLEFKENDLIFIEGNEQVCIITLEETDVVN